jgi:hypothetical protein
MEASTRVVVALQRLKDLFLEFPETVVSLDEASGLLALEAHQCHALLSALEDVRFLERNTEGKYGLRYVEARPIGGPARGASSAHRQPIAAG